MEPGRGLCPQSPKSTPFARRLPLMRGMNRYPFIVLAIVFLLLVGGGHTSAHKPVTSKYDYNRDVFPLLREHCGRCHVKGGPGPMSLMTYADAVPWAVSIRDELSAGRMRKSSCK